jgi:hypothetical protein
MNLRIPCSIILAAACVALASPAVGQSSEKDSTVTVQTAKSADECLNYAKGAFTRAYTAAKKAGTKWDDAMSKAAEDTQRVLAKRCLARFPLSTAKSTELETIASLYSAAGMSDSARTVAELNVKRAGTKPARAEALGFAITLTMPEYNDSGPRALARLAAAEKLMTQLDAMGPAYAKAQFDAHNSLAGPYRRMGDPEKRRQHFDRALETARLLSGSDRKGINGYYIADSYANLADYWFGKGDVAKAREYLQAGMAETWDLEPGFRKAIQSTSLLENPSPPLVASNWFNTPANYTEFDPKGKISLVMITAHW